MAQLLPHIQRLAQWRTSFLTFMMYVFIPLLFKWILSLSKHWCMFILSPLCLSVCIFVVVSANVAARCCSELVVHRSALGLSLGESPLRLRHAGLLEEPQSGMRSGVGQRRPQIPRNVRNKGHSFPCPVRRLLAESVVQLRCSFRSAEFRNRSSKYFGVAPACIRLHGS